MRHAYFVVLTLTVLAAGGPALASTAAGLDAFHQQDFATALKELTPEAEKGDGEALYLLGRMHQAGFGVTRDKAKAAAHFEKAAEADHAGAQYAYAQILLLGDGVEQDLVKGVKWLFIAGHFNNHALANAQLKKLPMPRDVVYAARREAHVWKAARSRQNPVSPP